MSSRYAEFAVKLDKGGVQCRLCPRGCHLNEGQMGLCRGRENKEGKLQVLNYGQVCSLSLDPMEKKPLYHFHPGSNVLSLGTYGCNLTCDFCQNWRLSHPSSVEQLPKRQIEPEEVVDIVRNHDDNNCTGVAYTYSEPSVWYEFVKQSSKMVHEAGYANVLVTNAYLNEKPWRRLMKLTDASNIDVKGFNEEFYRQYCGGELDVVKRNTEIAVEQGVHVEITVLLIPEGTDDPEDLSELVNWVANMNNDIPLHLSRYYPHHRMSRKATPRKILLQAKEIAMQKLNNVYLGNLSVPESSDTICPECQGKLIKRSGYHVELVGLKPPGSCIRCGYQTGIKIYEPSS